MSDRCPVPCWAVGKLGHGQRGLSGTRAILSGSVALVSFAFGPVAGQVQHLVRLRR